MIKHLPILLTPLLAAAIFGCAGMPRGLGPLKLVETLDVQRYLGRWYEIARFTKGFEKNITGATAEYSLRPDRKLQVLNSGFRGSLEGPYTEARGVAWVPDPRRPAALKVSFFWPFAGDYLVFGLDPGYTWALVGSDSRDYLWFLARTPQITDEQYQRMRRLAEDQGYDLSRLDEVPQKPRP
jgi:apolipoprotein D and lipocalin family protein